MVRAAIELRGVVRVLGGRRVLDGVDLAVPEGATLALVGPSGAGKTTLLRLVNRLDAPDAGEVRVLGAPVAAGDAVALRRRIGYVVQDAALFPHLSAAANAEVVPRLLGWPAPRRRARVAELFSLLGLDEPGLAGRYPAELSGGQRQRVAIARALAADPPILLMDEPFGALDPITRARLQREFREVQRALGKTVLLVTHDMAEACALGDRVAVLDGGRLVQVGPPEALRAAPASELVARLLGGGA